MNHHDSLATSLARCDIELPRGQIEQLSRYSKLLWQWNEKLNLTRHTDVEKFVTRDVLDGCQLAGLLVSGERVLDVGTGGGVPGLILAIIRPDLHVTLIDSVGKKARAAAAMAAELDLPVTVEASRLQEHLPHHHYDTAVARAVGKLEKLLGWVEPHWDRVGRLLIIKGPGWINERRVARQRGLLQHLELRRLAEYPMPGTDSNSVILQIQPEERRQSGH